MFLKSLIQASTDPILVELKRLENFLWERAKWDQVLLPRFSLQQTQQKHQQEVLSLQCHQLHHSRLPTNHQLLQLNRITLNGIAPALKSQPLAKSIREALRKNAKLLLLSTQVMSIVAPFLMEVTIAVKNFLCLKQPQCGETKMSSNADISSRMYCVGQLVSKRITMEVSELATRCALQHLRNNLPQARPQLVWTKTKSIASMGKLISTRPPA
jgi:hypothetical protein